MTAETTPTLRPENWIGISQIILTIIGIFVGPWWAVRRSMAQFRSTKSWEKITEAYSNVLTQLGIVKQTNRLWYEFFTNQRIPNEEERGKAGDDFRKALNSLEQMTVAYCLLISPVAQKAIQEMINKVEGSVNLEQLDEEWQAIQNCINIVTIEAPKHETS
jgi:hypothetical protein